MSLMSLTAVELGKRIQNKEVTAVDATREALAAIAAREEAVGSFVTVDAEGALARAEQIQKKIDAGELTSPLAGVPVAIKDNMCTQGMKTTCSSKIFYNFIFSINNIRYFSKFCCIVCIVFYIYFFQIFIFFVCNI